MRFFNNLQKLLETFVPFDDAERAMWEQTKAFVQQNPVRFADQTFELGHVTASAWIVDENQLFTLLTRHKKLQRWLQLGGHVEPTDANITAAALREAREESNNLPIKVIDKVIFSIDVHEIPARGDFPAHLHYDIRFLMQANIFHALAHNIAESEDLLWVELEEVEQYNDSESVLRMVRKTQQMFGAHE